MSHSHHGHSHGGGDGGGGHDHGCHDEHDHDHDRAGDGEQQSLYAQIDRDNVVALNAESESMGRDVIKPRDAIEDETRFCQSEEDGEFMIRIPFTDTVKLRSIILRNGGGRAKGPEKMHVYSNASPDFSDLEGIEPTQSFDLVETSSPVTYNVRIAKFSSVTHLTLHFPTPTSASYEADSPTRITYLSFSGAALNLRRDLPTGVVYEAAPRPADHRVKDGDGGGGNWASQGWTSDQ